VASKHKLKFFIYFGAKAYAVHVLRVRTYKSDVAQNVIIINCT